MILEKDPGGTLLRDTLWKRLTHMGRFRSRLIVNRFGGKWVEFSEDQLIEMRDSGYLWSEVCPGGTATREDINIVVNQGYTWEYDRHKPLWRCQYCPKLADGTAVLITTINHAIGDGISLIATLFSLKDDDEDSRKTAAAAADRSKSIVQHGKKVKGPTLGPITKVRAFSYGVVHGLTSSTWKPDPKNAFSMPDVTKPSSIKHVAQAEAISLEEMKAVKNRFPGVTLNDIMMACMTGAIRSYLQEVNDPAVQKKTLVRGAFPINLRSPHEPVLRNGEPMNKWAYGMFKFDFNYKTRIELVWKVKRQIDKIKISPSPLIQHTLAKVLTKSMPRKLLLNQLLNMANLTTAQLSNVPGPQHEISICGMKVKDLSFYLFTPVGLYIGVMSYNGKVTASVNVDGSTGVDAKQLAKHWKLEFEALKAECDALGEGVQARVPRFYL